MIEIWKDILGYEGLYQVSNLGNVRSLNYRRSGKLKLLKQGTDNGYKRVELSKNGKKKKYWVHRLVAISFISNPNNYKEVNHKDEDKSNNNVNNLEWCTREYNINYGTAMKRSSENHKGEKHPNYGKKGKDSSNAKAILMYDKEGNFIRRFDCIADANEHFGKDRGCSNIKMCLRGKNKIAYGFIFKYEDEEDN